MPALPISVAWVVAVAAVALIGAIVAENVVYAE